MKSTISATSALLSKNTKKGIFGSAPFRYRILKWNMLMIMPIVTQTSSIFLKNGELTGCHRIGTLNTHNDNKTSRKLNAKKLSATGMNWPYTKKFTRGLLISTGNWASVPSTWKNDTKCCGVKPKLI